MEEKEVEPAAQALILGAMMWQAMIEANGGKEPETIWHYRRIGRRFGVRFRILPRTDTFSPLWRQSEGDRARGVIYLPKTRNRHALRLWAVHELGEAGCHWEGHAPQLHQVTNHRIACASERLCFQRK